MGDHTTESAFLCGEKAWVFKAPAGVEFELFTGFKDGKALKPDAVTLTDEGRLFSFSSLAPGNYRYTVSGEGYYAAVCNLAVTGLEEAKEREIDVDPGRKAGHGFEPSQPVRKYTDALYEKAVRADDETWKDFAPLFTTPSFAPGKARHEFTSQSELEAYLNGQIAASKDAYQFTLTYSGKNHYRLPLVVFTKTDLTGVSNYEDAAEKVRNNGKLTVHYQAQIHGNEPAPSEAALIYIHKLLTEDAFRDQLLERINLYVIPRLNPDGAEAFIRNELKENLNMNRDYMALQSAEVIGSVTAAKVFDPFVVIDAHEYTVENDRESSPYNDILMRTSAGMNKGPEAAAAEAGMMLSCFRKLKEHGLRASGYPDLSGRGGGAVVNGFNPILATTYFGLNGA
ncbi:MAG: hypothetical protein IKY02_04435, partial [Lachnospiraceae bacterium]|nr:hypothetical protein [Lachnospiraceae bacterium]